MKKIIGIVIVMLISIFMVGQVISFAKSKKTAPAPAPAPAPAVSPYQ